MPQSDEHFHSGSWRFVLPETEPESDPETTERTLTLTEGEADALRDVLEYVDHCVSCGLASASAASLIDFQTLREKARAL